ncbi:MAG: GTP cyclohydrolase I FolE [Planctomycetaceae bacterium]|nr:GTP cyclohydrolase I FolE [Planctomycetaceae bacterium]
MIHDARTSREIEITEETETSRKPAFDQPRIEAAVREILIAIGEDPDREGLLDTPRRVAKAYGEMFGGLDESPAAHLARQFAQDGNDPVMVTDIPFTSMCEHHLLPFTGVAHIAYQPQHDRVVGLSKLARTVQILARRPQQQERLTQQIREAIEQHLDPAGVLVMVEATHSCMQIRGAKAHGASMKTRSVGGRWERDAATRREIQEMMVGK